MRTTWAAPALYALALLVGGAAGLWRLPLTFDEAHFYAPAVRFFAEALPRVPLDYNMPSPPLLLALDGALFRLTGSFAAVRMLSTAAAIASVALIAAFLRHRARGWLVALMVGCLPPMIPYAFSLKQHWMTFFLLAAGFVLWQSERHWTSAAVFLLAAGTNQIAAAFVLMVAIRQLWRRGTWLPYAVPLAALGALVAYWHGPQPPRYRVFGTAHQPGFFVLYWPQLLVIAFEAGLWIVPMLSGWWRRAVYGLPLWPVLAFCVWKSGLIAVQPVPDPQFHDRAVGPAMGLLHAVLGTHGLAIAAASAVMALGFTLYALPHADDAAEAKVYGLTYGATMLPVPFLFESYYALYVLGTWLTLSRRIAASRSRPALAAQLAAIAFGVAYAVFRFRSAS